MTGELIRSNVLNTEKGPPVHLDINVIDTSGCKPVTDAYVELWGTNATVRSKPAINLSPITDYNRAYTLVCKQGATVMEPTQPSSPTLCEVSSPPPKMELLRSLP